MTSTPGDQSPDEDRIPTDGQNQDQDQRDAATEGTGAEMGVSEGEGSTFEPEEDPEAHG